MSRLEKEEAATLVRVSGVELDASSTSPRRLLRLASEQKCPCPQLQESLAECAQSKPPSCVRARFAIRAIVRALSRGQKDEEITTRLLERFGPREPETMALDGTPCRGDDAASVTIVIFSDFQCPFCSLAGPLLEKVLQREKHAVRLCFKHYPLRMHPQARLAAQAAAAAQLQGKFWPMHDRLFTHQQDLTRRDLLDHAKALAMDPKTFSEDLDSDKVMQRVDQDLGEARRLQVRGTPTFFINGREMTDPKTVDDFVDWIEEARVLSGL